MNMDHLYTNHASVIDRYVGIPYAKDGTNPETGVDCYNFVRLFYREQYAIDLPEVPRSEDWAEVDADSATEGDVVLLRMPAGRTHVGVYLEGDYMLHAHEGGVVVQSINDDRWARRVMSICRHRKLVKVPA